MMLFEKEHGVIVACDVVSIERFRELVSETYHVEGVVGYKVGATLGLSYGLKALADVVEEYCDIPLIYDHQKAGTDIPQMGEKFAEVCSNGGIKSMIIFPQAGPETEKAFIKAIFDKDMVPMVGGEMTHPAYLEKEGGFIKNDSPEKMYRIGAESGVEYFILPGNRYDAIKKYNDFISEMISSPKYCMPGIGSQGGKIEKAFSILEGRSAYAIVGSAIYKSNDIEKAAKELCVEALKFE
ncbi:MAG TPA: hypothetical protein ENL29_01180 [Thermoplasmatales archaeon]|nr:hypothetical protein [Thermoplasmatales archaeon]